jgi:uncharacterized protein (TIGR02001 family)
MMYRFLLPLALLSAPAFAQQQGDVPEAKPAPKGGLLPISAQATILSDYRFRGVTRSDYDPALQAQLTVSLPGGFYAGARATSLHRQNFLGDAELDFYAGMSREIAPGTTLDGGLQYYAFAGASGGRRDYAEPYASVTHTLGPVQATAGAKYAPAQAGTGHRGQLYLFGQAEADIPLTPVTLTAEAGRQSGGLLPRYWNWSVGGRYRVFGPVVAGLRYVATDLPVGTGGRAGVVGSLGLRF